MEQNLLEEVELYFTEDTVSQASAVVGESERGVGKALTQIIPLVLSSFIGRAERPGGVDAIWTLAAEATAAGQFQELLTAERLRRRTELMQGLLGEEYASTTSHIAAVTGVKRSSVETLLSMVAQAVLQSLGAHAHQQELNADALFAWLERQKADILAATRLTAVPAPAFAPTPPSPPAPVAPAPAAEWQAAGALPAGTRLPVAAAPTALGSLVRWAPLLLLLVLAGAALEYFFTQGRLRLETTGSVTAGPDAPASAAPVASAAPSAQPSPTSGRYDAASDNYIYDPGRPITLTLVDGSSQTVGVNSTENRLYRFLADPATQVDSINRTKGWINFDRVYFDAKKATLTDESRRQLRNVASILKSFPAAHVKIGGYTDTTGNVLANLKLSEERANTAMSELVSMGIALSRIEAKGYGGKHGVADNATPVGRALNRRISIRVTRK